ncbi:type IX secretion system membrane protein PorP/SprF [Flavobacteriaceae bacterium S0825]|uniref:PorP/SprF family type IX secretion system membrane protein n=1 Tax=Gaetbulibacter sp. S0825 TaxID=2720084 RepID=UPI0014310631|nr:type IX secretion system membrane protein PorP/SprF [Gaetbulibacter sp. S0825]MCK0108523.1 type IX secretion system membrane protein PorP/SprF [Flavobacteriaceae bacterium S0825]NIX64159.1 type IX secretion system membrane protein PorP/SprF [Gaetbulibacter sp. S0825]
MKLKKLSLFFVVLFLAQFSKAQEGLPIYSDYLTDNYYLIHPSMAGAANCNKVRLTGRQQWLGQSNAPSLQTLSVNGRFGETPSAYGAIVFNDKNGYHSQTGAYLTYAHHLMFSRNPIDLNMLSFGLSAGMIQYKLDETSFLADGFDPIISGIEQSATNFNIDFGFSYFFLDFYAHATVKNVLANDGINFNEQGLSYNNLRTFLFSAGNVFSRLGSEWSYEPSIMFMHRDATKESLIDLNMKVYKEVEFGKFWAGLSYRTSLDGAEFLNGTGVSSQKLQYITPLVGVNYKNFVFAYTYSYQANSVVFNNGGFHQITLGINFGCRREKYECKCPAIN